MSISQFQQQNKEIARLLTAISPPSLSSSASLPDPVLQSLIPDGKIGPSACTKIMDFCEKESWVKKKCDLSKVKTRSDDGRIYLIIKRKSITSTSYPGLNEVIEDIKGHAKEGKRLMPLTTTAQSILAKLKNLNPDSDFILIRNGHLLSTCTFNRHLKKCCEELGIEYRSSHKLRFSTASIMYKNGVKDTELKKLLGHTTLSMTQHYLHNIISEEETAFKMEEILG